MNCIKNQIKFTDGVGYHQLKGELRQTIKKGDVVKCPPDMMHRHGASPQAGLQKLYIVPNYREGYCAMDAAGYNEVYNNGN